MNKRQTKKREKITRERVEFYGRLNITFARQNGKTSFLITARKSILSKRYKYFKKLRRRLYDKHCKLQN